MEAIVILIFMAILFIVVALISSKNKVSGYSNFRNLRKKVKMNTRAFPDKIMIRNKQSKDFLDFSGGQMGI